MNKQGDVIKRACPRGKQADLARELEVEPSMVSQWISNRRPVPVAKGARLCSFLGIGRWELWPDTWHEIWPELVGVPGAPTPEQRQVAPVDEQAVSG